MRSYLIARLWLHLFLERVTMQEFNKINVIKELLNVKYNFASVPVLDLADIVFCIESLCTEYSLFIFHCLMR